MHLNIARSALALALLTTGAALAAPTATAPAVAAPLGTPTAAAPGPGGDAVDGWQVQAAPDGSSTITWTAPEPLPVTSARPTVVGEDGRELGPATVGSDRRSVTVRVAGDAPDVAGLDVVLSGRRLDEPGAGTPAPRGDAAPVARTARALLPDDPAVPGPHAVATSDYQLDAVRIDGLAQPVEMVGHVVEPHLGADTGPRPLVVFLHGRHEFCWTPPGKVGDTWTWPCRAPAREVPSHRGYDYLQRVLASQGFTTVSIRANGINAQDHVLTDGGAAARADLVDAHLAHWAGLASSHRVDLDRVVLVGHSRGGEGVNRASLRTQLGAPHTFVGQVLLAPTDFASQSSPYVPTVTVLPYCDGDVSDLQGQRFVEFGRDLADDDTALKSAVLVIGANHNYFNTEWTPGRAKAPAADDWYGAKRDYCGAKHAERLSAAEQRNAGTALVAGAVRLFADDAQQYAPLFDGSEATVASMGRAVTHSAAVGGGRAVRGAGDDLVPDGGTASARLCRAVATYRPTASACGRNIDAPTPNWPAAEERLPERQAVEVAWTASEQNAVLRLDRALDLSADRLDLRATVDPQRPSVRLGVRLRDRDGATTAVLPLGPDGLAAALPGGGWQPRHWAQSLGVVPSAAPDAAVAGVDLGSIVALELVGLDSGGRVWVHDAAATPGALAAVPAKRLPVVDLGRIEVDEGDGPGPGRAALPYLVRGSLTADARLRVVVDGPGAKHFDLVVPAGTTNGTLEVRFPRNRTYDDNPVRVQPAAYGYRGASANQYVGEVRVLDDEVPPKVRVRVPRRTVREGGVLKVVITMDAPVTDHRMYAWRFVRPRGNPARTTDLRAAWRQRWGLVRDVPLQRSKHFGTVTIKPGRRRAVLAVPVAADRRNEGLEGVAVKVRGPGVTRTARLQIRDGNSRR